MSPCLSCQFTSLSCQEDSSSLIRLAFSQRLLLVVTYWCLQKTAPPLFIIDALHAFANGILIISDVESNNISTSNVSHRAVLTNKRSREVEEMSFVILLA